MPRSIVTIYTEIELLRRLTAALLNCDQLTEYNREVIGTRLEEIYQELQEWVDILENTSE
jgi:hypothetical protein